MSKVLQIRLPVDVYRQVMDRGGSSWARLVLEAALGSPGSEVPSEEDEEEDEEPEAELPAPELDVDREQQLRDHFGYAKTEKRTERQRSDAAARMLKKDPEQYWRSRHPATENLLPPDNTVSVRISLPTLTEEQYVRAELSVTRAQLAAGLLKEKDADGNDLDVLGRSERYLRWRYAGFVNGEIASL